MVNLGSTHLIFPRGFFFVTGWTDWIVGTKMMILRVTGVTILLVLCRRLSWFPLSIASASIASIKFESVDFTGEDSKLVSQCFLCWTQMKCLQISMLHWLHEVLQCYFGNLTCWQWYFWGTLWFHHVLHSPLGKDFRLLWNHLQDSQYICLQCIFWNFPKFYLLLLFDAII